MPQAEAGVGSVHGDVAIASLYCGFKLFAIEFASYREWNHCSSLLNRLRPVKERDMAYVIAEPCVWKPKIPLVWMSARLIAFTRARMSQITPPRLSFTSAPASASTADLRAGLPGDGDLLAGRSAGEVAELHADQRRLVQQVTFAFDGF